MNLFLTTVFLYVWLDSLITWGNDALFLSGLVIVACGMYQSMLDINAQLKGHK